MLKTITITVASLAAALVIAGGLALAGYGAPPPAADMRAVDQVVLPVDAPAPADTATPLQIDTIYLAPQPTPEEITVTQVKEARHHDDDDDGGEGGEAEDD